MKAPVSDNRRRLLNVKANTNSSKRGGSNSNKGAVTSATNNTNSNPVLPAVQQNSTLTKKRKRRQQQTQGGLTTSAAAAPLPPTTVDGKPSPGNKHLIDPSLVGSTNSCNGKLTTSAAPAAKCHGRYKKSSPKNLPPNIVSPSSEKINAFAAAVINAQNGLNGRKKAGRGRPRTRLSPLPLLPKSPSKRIANNNKKHSTSTSISKLNLNSESSNLPELEATPPAPQFLKPRPPAARPVHPGSSVKSVSSSVGDTNSTEGSAEALLQSKVRSLSGSKRNNCPPAGVFSKFVPSGSYGDATVAKKELPHQRSPDKAAKGGGNGPVTEITTKHVLAALCRTRPQFRALFDRSVTAATAGASSPSRVPAPAGGVLEPQSRTTSTGEGTHENSRGVPDGFLKKEK